MPDWSRIATRLRVPLGFVFAALYLWFAHPSWTSISSGGAIILVGLAIRAAASGYIHKNKQLATTGPYAYTRNPLYLGSLVLAAGFIVGARSPWLGIGAAAMFLAIYLPVIQAEERYLRSVFSQYSEYARHVPRLLPYRRPYRAGTNGGPPAFSWELYLRHREYNAVLGSALMLGALILKLFLVNH